MGALVQEVCRPGSTRRPRVIQAAALLQAKAKRGGLFPIGVGAGKTDICALLGTVLGANVTVLLVPTDLKKKFVAHEYPFLATQYRLPHLQGSTTFYPDARGTLHVVSYHQLQTAKTSGILDELKPDLIVADEAHCLKHASASRTKRFNRYMKAHPQTMFCGLSGSMITKSIKDFAHLARYALKYDAPVPMSWPVLDDWASALDPSDFPTEPGELRRFCEPGEDVRSGFRRRLVQSPGIVATSQNAITSSLVFYERKLNTPPEVLKALEDVRASWVTPGGEVLREALEKARVCRQLATGMYMRWIWPRKEPLEVRREWLEARKEWHQEVRQMLKGDAKKGMDSPLLLAQAAATGRWQSETYERWAAAKDTARPETEVVWISDFLVEDAVAWGRQNQGVIWYEHAAIGQEIAKRGGFRFFGPGEEASEELAAYESKSKGEPTIVVSMNRKRGYNLQYAFEKMLYTTVSSNGEAMEQSIGRVHRAGQAADEVEVHIYRHTEEMREALESAIRDAAFQQEITENQQKLMYADYTFEQ